jgi:betaine-aldehyde dehydrogenase
LQAYTPIIHIREFASMAPLLDTPVVHAVDGPVAPGSWRIEREPIGVVGAYVPYNFPLFEAVWKVAPALLAGNTIVVKPSPLTPTGVQELAKAAEAVGLPPGVINVIHGDVAAGKALAQNPGVDFITFTGSTAVAREIAASAAQNLTPVMAELGGKSPSVVLEDADLRMAIKGSLYSGLMNSGQACVATTRVLVPDHLYDEAVALATEYAEQLIVGDPSSEATDIGPVISRRQLEKIEQHVARAREQGAKVTTGGCRAVEVPSGGFYYKPTVVRDVTPDMDIAVKEVFGPVIAFLRYGTVDEAVEIANSTPYGLASAVWGGDVERAESVSARIEAGLKFINDVGGIDVTRTPLAGRKQSGIGAELGPDGLFAYTLPASTYLSHGEGRQSAAYVLVGSKWG